MGIISNLLKLIEDTVNPKVLDKDLLYVGVNNGKYNAEYYFVMDDEYGRYIYKKEGLVLMDIYLHSITSLNFTKMESKYNRSKKKHKLKSFMNEDGKLEIITYANTEAFVNDRGEFKIDTYLDDSGATTFLEKMTGEYIYTPKEESIPKPPELPPESIGDTMKLFKESIR